MNYQQQLSYNRGQEPLDAEWKQEWEVLKIDKYRYDPTYDYLADIRGRYIKELDIECGKGQGLLIFNSIFCDPKSNTDKHKLAYHFWLDYKYKDFRRDWKPKDVDGLNFMWLTFNFSSVCSVSDIVLEITRIVNLAEFAQTKLSWCYEFYTASGSYPHVHMLVELKRTGTIKPSGLEQKIFQKKTLREIMNWNYKLSWAKDYRDRTQKRAVHLAYLDGMKNEKKQEHCLKDEEWRIENHLHKLYIKDN